MTYIHGGPPSCPREPLENFQILMLRCSLSPFFVSITRRDGVVYCRSPDCSYAPEFVTRAADLLVAKYRS